MSLYLWIDVATIAVPFVASFHPRLRFHARWFAFFPALILGSGLFLLWDILFTHWGIWGFNPRYLMGRYFFGLPWEEWLFFLCIPYACLFSYHCFSVLVKKDLLKNTARWISWVTAGILGVLGLVFLDRAYTCMTFLSTALVIAAVGIWAKMPWMGRFFFTWGVMLVPFLVVNGILTGTGLEEPIVWYDNSENLSLRILTIPIEDAVYGMLLMLLIVAGYEFFLSRGEIQGSSHCR